MKNRVTIDRYSDFEPIGEGGFSYVYKAWRADQNRFEAIKVLSLGSRREFDRDTFAAECRAMGAVSSHPHVVTGYDNGFTKEGYPFISMEFCRDSLADRIEAAPNRCMPVQEVLDIGVNIFSALDHAHRKGILHRDLKPQNILFTDHNVPVLTDFGIASIADDPKTQHSWALSRHYASPEVIDSERHTESCDIYSLGATLYTALAGRRPFSLKGDNGAESIEARIQSSPPPAIDAQEVPQLVEDAIMRLLSKHPRDRPATAADASRELAQIRMQLGFGGAAVPDQASRELDDTELRKSSDRQPPSEQPVDDATRSDPTRARTDAGYRPTDDFKKSEKSKRPLVAVAAVAAVVLVGAGGIAASQAGGPRVDRPGPTPTSTLPTSQPEVTPVVIPRAPSLPIGSRDGATVSFQWDPVDTAESYRVDPTTLNMPSATTDVPSISFEIDGEAVLCVVVHAIGPTQKLSRGSEQSCA